ncbi:21410_t:CDS:1, partial [Dentiscutata erythropus]
VKWALESCTIVARFQGISPLPATPRIFCSILTSSNTEFNFHFQQHTEIQYPFPATQDFLFSFHF